MVVHYVITTKMGTYNRIGGGEGGEDAITKEDVFLST